MKIFIIILVTVLAFFIGNFVSWQIMSTADIPTYYHSKDGKELTMHERFKLGYENTSMIINRSIEKDRKAIYYGSGTAVIGLIGSIVFFVRRDKKKKALGY